MWNTGLTIKTLETNSKEAVMIQLVQDFKIDDFINKLIDIITKIKSLHVIRRC